MAQAHNNTPAMARRSRIPSIFAPTRARRVWLPVAPKKCHGAGCQRQVAASLRTLHDSTLEEFSLFLLWLLAKRAVDGIDGNRRHHAVAFAIVMQAVIGEIGLEVAGRIDHGGKIIQVDISVLRAELTEPVIERLNGC